MTTLILNKPYGVLSKFTDAQGRPTLAGWVPHEGVYPAGRLDADSEGLLILTSDGGLQARIAHPRHKWPKTYWAQVEGEVGEEALRRLRKGILLRDGPTLPAGAERIAEPEQSLATSSADPLPQARPDQLDTADSDRGTQPAGATHDGCRGTPDTAADPPRCRTLDDHGPRTRTVARSGRAG